MVRNVNEDQIQYTIQFEPVENNRHKQTGVAHSALRMACAHPDCKKHCLYLAALPLFCDRCRKVSVPFRQRLIVQCLPQRKQSTPSKTAWQCWPQGLTTLPLGLCDRRLCRLHNKGCTSRKRRLPLSLLQAVSAYAVRASRLSGLSSSPKDRQDWMPRCKSSRATWPKVATVKRLSSTSWRRHHCRSARKAVTPPFYRTTSMRAGYRCTHARPRGVTMYPTHRIICLPLFSFICRSAAHATSGGTGLALCTSTYSTRTAGHSTADPASSMSVFRRMFKNCC